MSEGKRITLLKAAKELNIGIGTAVEFLAKSGYEIEPKPATKLDSETYDVLLREFQGDKIVKEEANQIIIGKIRREESPAEAVMPKPRRESDGEEILIKNTGSFVPDEHPEVAASEPEKEKEKPAAPTVEVEEEPHHTGMKIVGKIDLSTLNRGGKHHPKPAKEEVTKAADEAVTPKQEVPESKIADVPAEQPEKVAAAVEQPEEEQPPAAAEAEQPAPEASAPSESRKADAKAETHLPKQDVIRARAQRLTGPNVVGRIDLPTHHPKEKPVASSSSAGGAAHDQKRKRKRKDKPTQQRPGTHTTPHQGGGKGRSEFRGKPRHGSESREEPSEKEIQDQIKATLARLSGAGKSSKFAQRAKLRRQKRDDIAHSAEEAALEQEMMSKVLKVTEFVTANDLANMMGVQVTQIIATCMSLGLFVSINQRLDAETIAIVADEFGYEIEFVKPEDEENTELEEPDTPENLIPRAPIVTVMGHVDHGKTSLLDYVRKTNVIGGEAGGITQHIGAYEVTLDDGRKMTFLDTPGHEAFTAMRARGAQVTDIAIIVIAADDSVMPQTKEAINHAQAAGVPIVFAFTKIDKPHANADKIREQLSSMNILVEDWGGKYQCQEISGKTGQNVDLLLEKVLLEAELLELTADPKKRAVGSVIEASLDKGRGIVTTVLIQGGTLRVGAPILAGSHSGKVKALYNERGQRVTEAGASTPVQMLGMSGAPTAGDKFYEMESETDARQVANKRLQLQREQGLRTQKHITLDEIGRRLAIGNFKELNIIVKGDVDGSIEALSDSLLKLSTEEIQVNVIHKSVGQISESDVLLASASDAIIIGFQVRPSTGARKLAEQEQIDIRLYSIIYDAIEEVKAAMEGMLEPKYEEKIVANVEIRETFKISKVGTIAGCMVLDGKINRNHSIRVIRDGVVVYTGHLASLKRFKDDVKEVAAGYECGLNIQNFNDIKVGDIIEAYEQVEVKRKL
ncbi:translation initiation factor IF-2 [Parapedobacter soli]|uniref:translation initiation factor IF-2 n=1 Tax=Parapedobacter soli TaxID=416955 RepID=UPI0021C6F9DD|nr:translation initiation factor IF-2 [Parapedobacter soli]